MGGKHRTVLGRHEDARIGAAKTGVGNAFAQGTGKPTRSMKSMTETFIARVRRRLGNICAKVALAYLHRRHWSKTGIPKSTFYYALNKVEKNFHADKHWSKLRSAHRKAAQRLD